ncbi:MAG TPA: CheR family methyltransferase [Archangium sp.]|uniref:CheR family methyltransferase n=1 Tax=Archangium sp. TaxID=1872627 RepID=UPI002ED99896
MARGEGPTHLNDERTWPAGPFDLIFCRNVLIYFGAQAREHALQALPRRLPPTGHLFLGHAESITSNTAPVRCVAPNIYRRTPLPPPARTGSNS